jgi:CheY-like chemotaxis protein
MIHVLLVDGHDAVRECVAETLSGAGLHVTEASSAEEVLALANLMLRPDVLVTDVHLGRGMSGCHLAAAVRRRWPGLPILLTSGGPHMEYKLVARNDVRFLAKPFRRADLVRAIERVAHALPPA